MDRNVFFTVLAIALLASAVFFFSSGNGRSGVMRSDFAGEVSGMAKVTASGSLENVRGLGASVLTNARQVADVDVQEPAVLPTEDEKREAEESALVDAFDALTDKWMESTQAGVSMKAVEEFSECFRKVPQSRKEECLHRALNLIPDENVMLLAGMLFDKTLDKEMVEIVFHDILNRDESVKKPIMQQIFKDKTHPCWADVAWIFDVTGGIPKVD